MPNKTRASRCFGVSSSSRYAADVSDHIRPLGNGFGAGRAVGHEAGRRRRLFVIQHFVEGGILPAFTAQVGEGNADGDLMHPGGEHAAAFEGVQLVEDAQESLLGHLFDERREERVIGREPAREGIRQAVRNHFAQVSQRGFAQFAFGAQIGEPGFVGSCRHEWQNYTASWINLLNERHFGTGRLGNGTRTPALAPGASVNADIRGFFGKEKREKRRTFWQSLQDTCFEVFIHACKSPRFESIF